MSCVCGHAVALSAYRCAMTGDCFLPDRRLWILTAIAFNGRYQGEAAARCSNHDSSDIVAASVSTAGSWWTPWHRSQSGNGNSRTCRRPRPLAASQSSRRVSGMPPLLLSCRVAGRRSWDMSNVACFEFDGVRHQAQRRQRQYMWR